MFGLFRNRKSRHGARGYGQCTQACVHLKDGKGLGWFVPADAADDDYWPLAWCADCNEVVEAAGGIERAVTALRLTSFCDACYEEKRERNWRGGVAFNRSGVLGPWKTDLERLNHALAKEHDLSQYDWNDWKEELLVLRKRATGERVAVKVQPIGSFSQKTETWLWSWGQPKASWQVKHALRFVRAYGREQGSMKLTCSHWPATERDVFEMTAIAAHLIPSIGEYRLPNARGYYVLLVLAVEALGSVD